MPPTKIVGVPIKVVGRKRPTLPGDASIKPGVGEDEILSEGDCLDYLYDETTNTASIFARDVRPLVAAFVDGISSSVISFGATGTGKTFSVEGTDMSTGGLASMLCESVFVSLNERIGRMAGRVSSTLCVQYCEIYNELIEDLLDTTRTDLSVVDDVINGPMVTGASLREVHGPQQLLQVLADGRAKRQKGSNALGSVHSRAASVFLLVLTQQGDSDTMVSRFMMVDMPGAEKLADDPGALRVREGPTLNQGIIAYGNLIKDLATQDRVDFGNYEASNLTKLLHDALGGNSRTLCIAHLVKNLHYNLTLRISSKMRNVVNYPVVNNGLTMGLIRKLRVTASHLRDELAARGDSSGGDATGLLRLHELEGKLIREEIEKLRLKEEAEKLYQKLVEVRDKYTALLGQKSDVHAELLAAEEEKIKISKALIDLRIENTSLQERGEEDKFELMNKILTFENDVMELEMKLEKSQKRIKELEDELKSTSDETLGLQTEFVALKHNYINSLADIKTEQQKNEDLSLEIINLVNARNALQEERDRLLSSTGTWKGTMAELEMKVVVYEGQIKELEKHLADSRQQIARLQVGAEQQQVDHKRQMLELQSQMQAGGQAVQQESSKKELEQMRLMQERLLDEMATLTRQRAQPFTGEEDVAALKAEISKLRRRLEDQAAVPVKPDNSQHMTQLERENAELRRALQAPIPAGGDKAERQKYLQLERENAELRRSVQDFNSRPDLSQKLKTLERENAELRRMMQESSAGRKPDNSQRVMQLERENAELRKGLTSDGGGERERYALLARATMAEAQVEQMQEYMNAKLAEYQREIHTLRQMLQQYQVPRKTQLDALQDVSAPAARVNELLSRADVGRMSDPGHESSLRRGRGSLSELPPPRDGMFPARSRSALSRPSVDLIGTSPIAAWPDRLPTRDQQSSYRS
eukprot:TRINITY_DN5479_c0_g1_i1.p1 TRINITY_DN5479_c0_g1~~TRINITY_DN5479_c0_g1_i1.p1  ORF type:complete len:931 (-),score=273.93 TRINITY_DN5479_c0_g1_i1:1445-4237(-)